MTKHRINLLTGIALAALTAAPLAAHAQPDANNAPKADNPPNWNRGGGPGGGQGGQGGQGGGMFQQWQNATPEQRADMMKQMRVRMAANVMSQAGITDKPTQTAITDYYETLTQGQDALRDAYAALRRGLMAGQNPAGAMPAGPDAPLPMPETAQTNDQLTTALKTFRDAVAAEKDRRTKAAADLDAKIHYTANPRLETFLEISGLINDDAMYASGTGSAGALAGMLGGMNGGGGFGGGGFGGGGFGGRGGQGGQGGRGGRGGRGGQGGGQGGAPGGAPGANPPPPPPVGKPGDVEMN